MSHNPDLSVVILAAGKGTRMKSSKAKVLHEVFFQPMLHHVLSAVKPLQPRRTVVIVGHQEEVVRRSLETFDVLAVKQEEQLGTGHAVLMTEEAIPEDDGVVMILCGDTPLVRAVSLNEMLQQHRSNKSQLTIMTTILNEPFGYGRIISENKCVQYIVEEKEADTEQRKIQEVNAGIYIVNRRLLFQALQNVDDDNTQGEYYLTDIVQYTVKQGIDVHKYVNSSPKEVLGVNSRVEQEEAHRDLQIKRNEELMMQGISMHGCDTISVSPMAEVGIDCLLMSNVQILGSSVIGSACIIENGAIIKNCNIGNNVRIGAYCVLEESEIPDNTVIQPCTVMAKNSVN